MIRRPPRSTPLYSSAASDVYKRQVKAGEEVVITDRGRPVARIVKEPVEERSFRETRGDLVESGLVVLPSRSIRKDELAVMVEVSGKPVSEMVTEDRR